LPPSLDAGRPRCKTSTVALEGQTMNDPELRLAGARLLVVDDTDISAELAAEMLQTLDMTCVVATDGGAALAILAMAGLSDLPILAMTGNTTPEDLPHILASGMNARITKPLSLQRLSRELNRWIRPGAVGAGAAR
jgi:CheY-like chemotaxis protein